MQTLSPYMGGLSYGLDYSSDPTAMFGGSGLSPYMGGLYSSGFGFGDAQYLQSGMSMLSATSTQPQLAFPPSPQAPSVFATNAHQQVVAGGTVATTTGTSAGGGTLTRTASATRASPTHQRRQSASPLAQQQQQQQASSGQTVQSQAAASQHSPQHQHQQSSSPNPTQLALGPPRSLSNLPASNQPIFGPKERIGINVRADITRLIGSTPMVFLNRVTDGCFGQVAAKLENFNPAASVADRVAWSLIDEAERDGRLMPGQSTIIEATCGDAGVSLAAIAAVKGYAFIGVMPEDMSLERRCLLAAYGADVVVTPSRLGMQGAIKKARRIARSKADSYFANQYFNTATSKVHATTTGPEIWKDTCGMIDVFVCGVGTGGTLTGVAQFLKSQNSHCRIVAVEPSECAVLSGGDSGFHKIQGLGPGFTSGIVEPSLVDEFFTVRSDQAMEMARRLPRSEGILCSISGGAAVFAAVEIARKPEMEGKLIVCILPSTAERELSTALFDDVRMHCVHLPACPDEECE